MINKDTKIYASFSQNPGNQGCLRFNTAFEKNGINAIYKSFKVPNIKEAFYCAQFFGFSGFAVSMPFKTEAMKCCHVFGDEHVNRIRAANTVILDGTHFIGYNTDYWGIHFYLSTLSELKYNRVAIIGTGAFARAAQYVFEQGGVESDMIPRSKFGTNLDILQNIENRIVFNATPLKLGCFIKPNNLFIDCDPASESGKQMSYGQARAQFYDIYGFSDTYDFDEIA